MRAPHSRQKAMSAGFEAPQVVQRASGAGLAPPGERASGTELLGEGPDSEPMRLPQSWQNTASSGFILPQ